MRSSTDRPIRTFIKLSTTLRLETNTATCASISIAFVKLVNALVDPTLSQCQVIWEFSARMSAADPAIAEHLPISGSMASADKGAHERLSSSNYGRPMPNVGLVFLDSHLCRARRRRRQRTRQPKVLLHQSGSHLLVSLLDRCRR